VYYLLSEYKSFWKVPEDVILKAKVTKYDDELFSPFLELLPEEEPMRLNIDYLKQNAIARIVDGRIHSFYELAARNYQI